MVIGHLFAVQHPAKLRGNVQPRRKGKQRPQAGHDAFRRGLHIVGKILAVGAGIGQQLLFVEALCVVKGLLRRVAKQPVCLTLQGGKIIELRRLFLLLLLRDRSTGNG